MTAERTPTQRAAPQTPDLQTPERGTIWQSQTAATGIVRAAARLDSREGQRPRLTQISTTASPHFQKADDTISVQPVILNFGRIL